MTFFPSEVQLSTGFRAHVVLVYAGDAQIKEQDEGRDRRRDPDRFHVVHVQPADVAARKPGNGTDDDEIARSAPRQDDDDHGQEQRGVNNAKEKEKVEQSRRKVQRQTKGDCTSHDCEGVAETNFLPLTRFRSKQLIDVVHHEANHGVQSGSEGRGDGAKGAEHKKHEQKQGIDFSDKLKQQGKDVMKAAGKQHDEDHGRKGEGDCSKDQARQEKGRDDFFLLHHIEPLPRRLIDEYLPEADQHARHDEEHAIVIVQH